MSAGVPVVIRPEHLDAMTPGPLRDQVAYAVTIRTARAADRVLTEQDHERLRELADLERTRAILRYADTEATCADRRTVLRAAARAWHDTSQHAEGAAR